MVKSKCCDQYILNVIKNYLNRAYKVLTSWNNLTMEFQDIKRILLRNKYEEKIIGNQIKKCTNSLQFGKNFF